MEMTSVLPNSFCSIRCARKRKQNCSVVVLDNIARRASILKNASEDVKQHNWMNMWTETLYYENMISTPSPPPLEGHRVYLQNKQMIIRKSESWWRECGRGVGAVLPAGSIHDGGSWTSCCTCTSQCLVRFQKIVFYHLVAVLISAFTCT